MWNNRIGGLFKRIFVMYALLMTAAVIIVELTVTHALRENYIDNLRDNLVIQAKLISHGISFRPGSFDGLCRQLKQKSDSRVTLVGKDGKVIGDSDSESAGMDNHANREEIRQAALENQGTAIRFSETLKHDFLYVAVKADHDAGFVRLSMPLKAIDAAVNALRLKILSIVFSILTAAAIFSIVQMEHLRRVTDQIRIFAKAIAAGQVGKKLFLSREGEFEDIAQSLNTMSEELKNRITVHEEEQQRLSTILKSIPDALFIIDPRGFISLSSGEALKLFGRTAHTGKRLSDGIRNSEFRTLMETARKEKQPASAEIMIDRPPLKHCFVVQASPLVYERRELSGFIVIFHDISSLKKLEQTRKDFVANISHEIRTPITAIQGFADTLLEGALDDKVYARRFLETIKSNSERINNLIEDLMTISRLEFGVLVLEKNPVDLAGTIDEVVVLLNEKAGRKNVKIEVRLAPLPRVIEADRNRLIQILTNLVDNAIKFTEKGGVTIGLLNDGDGLRLFVEDTGIGIDQKHLPRLGERFYRVDPGRSRNLGGTGLGFAIVKHLVKAHGWEMSVESTLGRGTRVMILISGCIV